MNSMNISIEDTLPDDAWKDSFDKLLDQRPILRELNVIKRNVRASFNMNSSFENSSNNSSRIARVSCDSQPKSAKNVLEKFSTPSTPSNVQYLDVPKVITAKSGNRNFKTKVISTPIKRNAASNPLNCTISPIGPLDVRHSHCNKKVNSVGFNAAPIKDNIIVNIEYVGGINPNVEKETNPSRYSLGISPLAIVRQKWKTKESKKHVCFADENTTKNVHLNAKEVLSSQLCSELNLNPGKWRRSLNSIRRTRNCLTENSAIQQTQKTHSRKRRSKGIVERLNDLTTTVSVAGNRTSIFIRPSTIQTRKSLRSTYSLECNDFKRQILQRCGQRRVLNFGSAYNEEYLKNCCKIGEGAFGEVFLFSNPKGKCSNSKSLPKTVLKIIPIEGKQLINGEVQKTFDQILPEIIISMELSELNNSNRSKNITSGFVNLQRVRCVKGLYPSYLQKLWEDYDLKKESENDHPKCFTSNQQYIVLELSYGGQDIEGFHFKNAEETFSALQQIILTLAVAEREHQFEHRDLHWGNVLVLNTKLQNISYKLDDDIFTIPTKGIITTIIDYTLSRMTLNDYCYYNDLSNDEELFSAYGDYQFEIYRMMRTAVNDKWETFEPKTNIFWISYILSKFVEGVTYKSTTSKNHFHYLDKLKQLQRNILTYKSCAECARDVLSY